MIRNSAVRLVVMVAVIVAFGALPVLAAGLSKPSSKVPDAQKLIDKAWALDRSEVSSETYKQCIALMEQADKLDPNNPTILIDIARYYWNYGDNLPKATPEQQKALVAIYAKGAAAAEKSVKIKESVGAHYWFAVNRAASLEFAGLMSQVKGFPPIYQHSQYVSNNDPGYYYGSNGRLWSEIITRVPKKAVEIVGKKYLDEAIGQIDAAIKAEPRYLDNYVFKARFYWTYFQDKDQALSLLDKALKPKPEIFPEEVTANKNAQKNARLLWKKITGKEYPQK